METAARLLWAVTSQRVWDDLAVDQGWSTSQYRTHLTAMLEAALLPATHADAAHISQIPVIPNTSP